MEEKLRKQIISTIKSSEDASKFEAVHIKALTNDFSITEVRALLANLRNDDPFDFDEPIEEQKKVLDIINTAFDDCYYVRNGFDSYYEKDPPGYFVEFEIMLLAGQAIKLDSPIESTNPEAINKSADGILNALASIKQIMQNEVGTSLSSIQAAVENIQQLENQLKEKDEIIMNLNNEIGRIKEELEKSHDNNAHKDYRSPVNYDNIIKYYVRKEGGSTREIIQSMLEALMKKDDWDRITEDIEKEQARKKRLPNGNPTQITIQGDYVASQTVLNQVNGVEAGGTGIITKNK